MELIGYYIQPVAFYLIALLTLKFYNITKKKLSNAVNSASYGHVHDSINGIYFNNLKVADYFGVKYDEFNWFKLPADMNSLWGETHLAYLNKITDGGGAIKWLNHWLLWANHFFVVIELLFPPLILLAYLFHFFLGPAWIMCGVIDIINAISIITAALLLFTAWIPVAAYRALTKEGRHSEAQSKLLKLTLLLLHISPFIRIWGLFRKVEFVVRWIFSDEEIQAEESKPLAG